MRVRDLLAHIRGAPVTPAQTYRITVNSFLAEGADGFTTLTQGTQRSAGAQDIDAMLDYLKPPAERAPVPQPRVTRLP